MDALLPTEVFALEVQPGETVPVIDAPASFRITMAAIDPTAPAIADPDRPDAPPRATLKMIRHYEPLEFDDDEDDLSDEDIDDDDVAAIERKLGLEAEDDSEDDSEDGAGPSDPAKSKKARVAAVKKQLVNGDDDDVDMDELPNGVNDVKKGKAKAADEEDDEEDDDELDEDDVELPLCTLDTTHHYQQALDLTVMDPSSVSFKVIGTHSIFLTGNFVEIPEDDSEGDSEDDEEDEYGNALDSLVAPYGEEDEEDDDEEIDSEEDELDYLEDPRIEEIDTDEEEAAPKLIKAKAAVTKGKNKRPAESEDEEADDLDKLISKTLKSADASQTNGEPKLSKKQLKKLKKNDGQAAPGAAAPAKDEVEKKSAVKDSPANGKKVQFAKELEQGPTPTKADAAPNAKKEAKSQNKGVKVVQGVSIDERKEGQGPGVKKGDRVGMRYIGKLEKDGKVFDSNKKGKPFSFKLGTGEVIKGWDVGLQGMKVGGERRITIPPSMAYGSQKLPDIPPNSTLVFDVKCLTIN